jgi:transposase InsO family protein
MRAFIAFKAQAEAEAGTKLGTLRTDHGGEFTAHLFVKYSTQEGIRRHFTAPHTLEQNGVVERMNQTIMGMARSMLKAMKLPGWLWGEAVSTSVYILNRSPTQNVEGCTPHEAWYGLSPLLTLSYIWMCGACACRAGNEPSRARLDSARSGSVQ